MRHSQNQSLCYTTSLVPLPPTPLLPSCWKRSCVRSVLLSILNFHFARLALYLQPGLLQGLITQLLNMKTIQRYYGIRKALFYNGMHAVRKVHCDLFNQQARFKRECLYYFNNIVYLRSFNNSNDGAFAPASTLV